jgi:hypothetical protein
MDENRKKALELALVGIEKQYGKGAVMRLDAAQEAKADLQIIGSGSVSLDIALGVGGFPRGASSRCTVRRARARPRSPCTPSPRRRSSAAWRPSSTPSTPSTSTTRASWA